MNLFFHLKTKIYVQSHGEFTVIILNFVYILVCICECVVWYVYDAYIWVGECLCSYARIWKPEEDIRYGPWDPEARVGGQQVVWACLFPSLNSGITGMLSYTQLGIRTYVLTYSHWEISLNYKKKSYLVLFIVPINEVEGAFEEEPMTS